MRRARTIDSQTSKYVNNQVDSDKGLSSATPFAPHNFIQIQISSNLGFERLDLQHHTLDISVCASETLDAFATEVFFEDSAHYGV